MLKIIFEPKASKELLKIPKKTRLRILDKIEALHFATLRSRPTVQWWDLPVMLWRALWM